MLTNADVAFMPLCIFWGQDSVNSLLSLLSCLDGAFGWFGSGPFMDGPQSSS